MTVRDIVEVLRDRAFALLVVLLGLPNCLPMPPPIPLVCGLLLALVAGQLMAGLPAPWLPPRLLSRSIRQEDVARAVRRAVPVLQRLELWSRPRMTVLESALALRFIGFGLFVLALGIIFAWPLVGQIPGGIAVCLVGLGLVERDGVLVLAGFLVGSVSLTLSLGLVVAMVSMIDSFI